MGRTLLDKVWDLHKVATLPSGQDQLFIGLHLVHEVTSPQAFQALSDRGLKVLFPGRTFATVDHIVPTDGQRRPFADELAEQMMQAIERNATAHGITFFGNTDDQGIVHIIGPELGLTQPGMTIACGDSHTSTHGALGSHRLRRRDLADPRHPRHADPRPRAAQGAAHRGDGNAAPPG